MERDAKSSQFAKIRPQGWLDNISRGRVPAGVYLLPKQKKPVAAVLRPGSIGRLLTFSCFYMLPCFCCFCFRCFHLR